MIGWLNLIPKERWMREGGKVVIGVVEFSS